ncbi:LPXTG cell wall anchor domain-containing protein [Streptococcus suis]|uniref:LPXTG cell wall anchor domain-containing protein n=1 Tax=Streptococcus suis TaxID=1307 RepID=UPI000CF5945E|nr:LPXTG cell wall anchor domain-containing protein [Streptococcus suis]HEM2808901.1 LPXTG cell wall anchor domain-containing protein [Streptococcus suis]
MKKTSKYVLLLSAGLLLAPVALNHIVDVPTVHATETVASKEITIAGGYYGQGVAIDPFTMTVKVGDVISIDDLKAKYNITAATQSFEMVDWEGAPTKTWNSETTSIVITEELLGYDNLRITFESLMSNVQHEHHASFLNLVDGSHIKPTELNPKDWNGAPQIPGYIHVALYGEGVMGRSVSICYYVPEGTDLATVRRLIDEKRLGNFVVKNLDSLFLTEVAPVGNESSQSSNTGNTASVETPVSDIGTEALFTATDFPGYSEEQVLAAQVAYTLHKIGGEAISPLFASGVKTTFSSKEAGSQATSFVPNVILPKKTYYIESGLTGIITYSTVITYSDNGDGTITVYSIPDSLDRLGTTLAEQEEKLNRLFNEGRVVSVLKPSKEEVLSRLQQMVGGGSSVSTTSTSTSHSESQSNQTPSGTTLPSQSTTATTGINQSIKGTVSSQEKSTGQTKATDKAADKKADKKNLPKTGQVGSWLTLAGLALLPMVAYFHKKQKKN